MIEISSPANLETRATYRHCVRNDRVCREAFVNHARQLLPNLDEPIEIEATVSQALPNAMFKLRLDNSDREILGIVSGKMRKHFIRILPGDRVKVELSPYDLTRGRIVFRQK